jgi:hypothetical protein
VNFGDGPQASKDARGGSARRWREQERARKGEAETSKAPEPNGADIFYTALLTPLGDPMLKRLDSPAVVPTGLYSAPPDREPQTPTQELDTGPVAAHKTFKIRPFI